MALMDWSESFDVGVDSMNDQHRALLNIMNQLFLHFNNGDEFTSYSFLLDELRDYTLRHFREEEAYMESIDYADLAKHKVIHEKLLENFGKHHEQIMQDQSFNINFFNFLKL